MILNNIKNNKERGFTIVELLIVIVIIGILAAITIVSYTGISNKAKTAANQSNANSVLAAATAVYAENGAWPATNATSATVIANLNAGVTKVPSGITVTNVTVASGTASNLSYRIKGTSGVCVGYWDYSANSGNGGVIYLFGGDATSDDGTSCL